MPTQVAPAGAGAGGFVNADALDGAKPKVRNWKVAKKVLVGSQVKRRWATAKRPMFLAKLTKNINKYTVGMGPAAGGLPRSRTHAGSVNEGLMGADSQGGVGHHLDADSEAKVDSTGETDEEEDIGSSSGADNGIVFMATFIGGVMMYQLAGILIPLVMAIFLSSCLVPMLDLLTERPLRVNKKNCDPGQCCTKLLAWEKQGCLQKFVSSWAMLRVPNGLGVLIVIVSLFTFFGVISFVMYLSVIDFMSGIDKYKTNWDKAAKDILDIMKAMNVSGYANNNASSLPSPDAETLASIGKSVALYLLNAVAQICLMMLYVCFLLAGRPVRAERKQMKLTYEIEKQLKVYSTLKFAVSALTGVMVAITLLILGVDLAAPFGLMAFCLNFIPNVGSVLSTFLPMPIVILSSLPYLNKLLAFIIPFCIQFAVGNFIEPLLFGSRLAIHPITVLFALVLWNRLWGIMGAFLSVPITSAIKILLSNIDHPTSMWLVGLIEGNFDGHTALEEDDDDHSIMSKAIHHEDSVDDEETVYESNPAAAEPSGPPPDKHTSEGVSEGTEPSGPPPCTDMER